MRQKNVFKNTKSHFVKKPRVVFWGVLIVIMGLINSFASDIITGLFLALGAFLFVVGMDFEVLDFTRKDLRKYVRK